jgi:hypothetical protein
MTLELVARARFERAISEQGPDLSPEPRFVGGEPAHYANVDADYSAGWIDGPSHTLVPEAGVGAQLLTGIF